MRAGHEVAFRARRRRDGLPPSPLPMPLYPWLAVAGIAALVAILVDAFFIDLSIAWYAGVPWILIISVVYWIVGRRRNRKKYGETSAINRSTQN